MSMYNNITYHSIFDVDKLAFKELSHSKGLSNLDKIFIDILT